MATSQRKSNALALPDDVVGMLAAEDKRKNFPIGTMQSLMTQEVGGQMGKYLQDPTTYHYPLNANGKRIAKHTGKISTAFGPFGLLESTAKDPGYGVKPLANKSFQEQLRFASDYLDGRSKSAGSLNSGLAGYGEGNKYAAQVARRTGTQNAVPAQVLAQVQEPVQVTQAQVAPAPAVVTADATPVPSAVVPVAAASVEDQLPVATLASVAPVAPDAWQEFLARSRVAEVAPPVMAQAQDQAYKPLPLNVPDFMSMVAYMNKDRTPTGFQGFTGMDASV
jgi:hypothetical protein